MEFYDGFDEQYLERLRAGDYLTVQHFCGYFGKLLHIKLRSNLRLPQDVEDAKQTVFARFFEQLRKPDGIRDPRCLGAYVLSICKYVLMEKRRECQLDQLDDLFANAIPDLDKNAETQVSDKETRQIVREILDELGERNRRILRELYLEEREKDEICGDYQVTRGYLRVLVKRAKDSFRDKLRRSPAAARLSPKSGQTKSDQTKTDQTRTDSGQKKSDSGKSDPKPTPPDKPPSPVDATPGGHPGGKAAD